MECHGQIATCECCDAPPATTHGIALRNGETSDTERLILGIRQFYDFARGAANGLQAEGEALWGEDDRDELVCPHIDDRSRAVIAIDDSRITCEVLARQGRSRITTCIDGRGTVFQAKIVRADEFGIHRDVAVDSRETSTHTIIGFSLRLKRIIELNERWAILVYWVT